MRHDIQKHFRIVIRSFLLALVPFACLAVADRAISQVSGTQSGSLREYTFDDPRYGKAGKRIDSVGRDGKVRKRVWKDGEGRILEEENTIYGRGDQKTVDTSYFNPLPDGGRRLSRHTTTKTDANGTEIYIEVKTFDENKKRIGGYRIEVDEKGEKRKYSWDPEKQDYVEEPDTLVRITDREHARKPERIEQQGFGNYKSVYRNKVGQVIKEEEYRSGILVSTKVVETIYASGQEHIVRIVSKLADGGDLSKKIYYDKFGSIEVEYSRFVYKDGGEQQETIYYDKSGNPNARSIANYEAIPDNRGANRDLKYLGTSAQKWNPAKKQWEAAPKHENFNPQTRQWEANTTTYTYEDVRYGSRGERVEAVDDRGKLRFRFWRDNKGRVMESETITYGKENEKTAKTVIYKPQPEHQSQPGTVTTVKTDLKGNEVLRETQVYNENEEQIGGTRSAVDAKGERKTYRWNSQKGDYVEESAAVTSPISNRDTNVVTPSDASDNRSPTLPDNARATLDSMDGIKRSTSASPGYGAESTVANGLSVAKFNAPQGTISVYLPSDIAAGDTLSGTVVDEPKGEEPKQRSKHERELSDYVVELGNLRHAISAGRVLSLALPATISTASYLILRDKKGKEVCRSEVPVASSLPTSGEFTLPTLGQQGHPVEIRGSFDGNLSTTRVRIAGQDLQLLAESPRRLFARNTSNRAGLTEIELREGNQVRRGTFRSLGIQLSATKLQLLRGEGSTLTIVVTGLEDLRESIPLEIENKSPGVISMGGGNSQRVMIAPGDVRQGTYTTERPLTGIEPGGFTITATVTRNNQADQPQRGLVSP